MSNVKRPEPYTALQLNTGWNTHEEVVRSAIGKEGVISVFTSEQMEAYANEREQKTVDSIIDAIGDCHIDNHQFTEITERIRAIVPKGKP